MEKPPSLGWRHRRHRGLRRLGEDRREFRYKSGPARCSRICDVHESKRRVRLGCHFVGQLAPQQGEAKGFLTTLLVSSQFAERVEGGERWMRRSEDFICDP